MMVFNENSECVMCVLQEMYFVMQAIRISGLENFIGLGCNLFVAWKQAQMK